MPYSLRQIARDLLHTLSHRRDNTWHGLCWTSRQHWLKQVCDIQIVSELSTRSKRMEQSWHKPSISQSPTMLTHTRWHWATSAPPKRFVNVGPTNHFHITFFIYLSVYKFCFCTLTESMRAVRQVFHSMYSLAAHTHLSMVSENVCLYISITNYTAWIKG